MNLEDKIYLRTLETYDLSWSLEKCARDTLQNFFDSNSHTLDGIEVQIKKIGNNYTVKIESKATYDYQRLLHYGGGTKSNDIYSTGGRGEGTKVLALSLLRDYAFSQVRYSSNDWQLDFTLENVEEYNESVRGLFANVKEIEPINGNYIEFITSSKENAEEFQKAINLFYHSNNPDFLDATLDIPKVGGFKILIGKKPQNIPQGNLYHIGERRHFEREKWQTVERLNIWTYKEMLTRKDRDRGIITRAEVQNQIIPGIIQGISTQNLEETLLKLKPLWTTGNKFEISYQLLTKLIERISEEQIQIKFSNIHIADDKTKNNVLRDVLKDNGYTICLPIFSQLNMPTITEIYQEMVKHIKVEPSKKEKERMDILYYSATHVLKQPKEIWLYDSKEEKNIIKGGQYAGNFVWLSKYTINSSYNRALSLYIHELDHKHGTDDSAEFSYALTDSLDLIIKQLLKKPKIFNLLKDEWDSIKL